MQEIIVTKGIPASGKSTFARDLISKNPGAYKRINNDDLRAMLDNSKWSPDNEKFVTDLRDHMIMSALKKGLSVIVDNTHLHTKHENKIREIAQRYANSSGNVVTFKIKWFHIEKKEAIERDSKREGTAQVGKKVIEDMYESYSKVKNKQDSTEMVYPAYTTSEAQDDSLPKIVIVDIDGTLADMNGKRGPFEWHKVGDDDPKHAIIELVNMIAQSGMKVIFFSGRDAVCRPQTTEWLQRYFDFPIELYMRPQDDYRKDNIIKLELYNNHIRGKYFVAFTVDDRNQVVDMWRNELGLTCLQVAPGDF